MSRKFTIYTEKGKSSSLKQAITVALTLTPVGQSVPYEPVAWRTLSLKANSEDRCEVVWESMYAFSTYSASIGSSGKRWCSPDQISDGFLAPGQSLVLSKKGPGQDPQWGELRTYNGRGASTQPCVVAKNATGVAQRISLRVRTSSGSNSIAAYAPLESGQEIVAPTDLMFQAYIVDFHETFAILQAEDLKRPLFPVSLSCDNLPSSSAWRLSQDSGVFQLQCDGDPQAGLPRPTEAWKIPLAELKSQQDAMLRQQEAMFKTFSDHQRRVEESLAAARKDLASGQNDVAEIRSQLSDLERKIKDDKVGTKNQSAGPDPRVSELETRTDKLAKTFGQTKDYLTSVQQFLHNTRQQVAVLDSRVPAVEAKADKALEGLSSIKGSIVDRDELSAVQDSLVVTGGHLLGLEERVSLVEAKTRDISRSLDMEGGSASLPPASDGPVIFPSRPNYIPPASQAPRRPLGNDLPVLPSLDL